MEETGVDYASPGRRSIGNTQEKEEKTLNKRGCPFPQLLLFFLAFTCPLHFSCVIKRRQKLMLYKLFLQLIYFKLPCAAFVLASSQRATEPLFPNLFLVIQINLIHVSWENFLIDLFFFIFLQSKASPKAVCCQYIKNSLLLRSHNYRWGQKLPF